VSVRSVLSTSKTVTVSPLYTATELLVDPSPFAFFIDNTEKFEELRAIYMSQVVKVTGREATSAVCHSLILAAK